MSAIAPGFHDGYRWLRHDQVYPLLKAAGVVFTSKDKIDPTYSGAMRINGERVYVSASFRQKHRIHVECQECQKMVPFGRLQQHKCKGR